MPNATFEDGVASAPVSSGGVFVVVRATGASLATLDEAPTFAVVSGDFTSSALAMLDAAGDPLDEAWFTSGDALAGLVAVLGGDVTMPTTPSAGHVLVLDRFRTDVISRFAVPSGQLVGQLRTHDAAAAPGFSSNPQDVLELSPTRAWVSRLTPNVDASAPASEGGSDIVEIDPSTMTRTGNRIDFSTADVTVEGVRVYARPARMVALGDRVVVGLSLLSADFLTSTDGAVALVDPASPSSFVTLSLAGLRNCGTVVPVPGDATRAMVSCTGHSSTFDASEARLTAGVVLVHLESGVLSEERRWVAAESTDRATAVQGIVALSANEFVAAEYGDFFAGTNDRVVRVDLTTGAQTVLFTAAGAFVIGTMAFDPTSDLLLIPDASFGAEQLRRFTVGAESVTEGTGLPLTRDRGLAPRHAYLIAD